MSLSRKRKKELRKLQHQANTLWESQQILLGEAGHVAREAGRQLGNYNREQVVPTVQHTYEKYAAPYVEQGVTTSKKVYNDKVVPAAGALIGSALSVWDAANEKRGDLAAGRGFGSLDLAAIQKKADKYGKKAARQLSVHTAPAKKGMGAGGVIAILLGIAAAAGVVYAAWQTLRADDELWVADDPLRAPDA
ncbi:DNA helicase [Microbacterium sp. VKM Ac-2870]|uniref:DNA helicase n=1 Tax=Microbacterium sp. VKM Ac-2870 TaxID=2783825 RepID=UPI00188B35BD|nr:DNA helicase [Microbacterium sp. VKM Ac-2870]MBF4562603.1 DNA helicase [Microbacterium sp. VKM Ac-2870]